MYACKYVTAETGQDVFPALNPQSCSDIIDNMAAHGWRYAGFLPLSFIRRGTMTRPQLTFEHREAEYD